MNAQFFSQDEPRSRQYISLRNAIITPVFCVCLIAAIGTIAGVHHVVTMQFAVDRDTEYIQRDQAALLVRQHYIENVFHTEIKN